MTLAPFSQLVGDRFGSRAATYTSQARLQQGVAWRLAHLCAALPIPATGARADLGAGSGLVGQALGQQASLPPLLQLDLCPELLAHNPLARPDLQLIWDLNAGLPPSLQQAALLSSSFALQWLDEPARQLEHWCGHLRPGGWLTLAVPTSGSFPQWRQAAAAAGVPCSALALPQAQALQAATARSGLRLRHCQTLRFSRCYGSGLGFLQQLQTLGASASRCGRQAPGQLRRLLRHWPAAGRVSWEVLLLLGQRLEPGFQP
ncbi:MAG: methyltransferase domain-containing protein [Synechococcus sp.]|nr:methyltransferase domain-containing protein [Synechococcus sp.]